jgi:asparagine N-glycosylation enzyme membrane subunit Stt3
MSGARAATVLEERPDLEDPLRAALAVDDAYDTWTFDDIPVDSGAFGELVSSGLVEKVDGEYRVVNPKRARAALAGEPIEEDAGADLDLPSLDEVDWTLVGALAGVLALVAVFRLFAWPKVFYGDAYVLSSNDPYYYRYWVETLAARGSGLNFAVLSEFPAPVNNGEPLMVATLWFFTALLGGGQSASGFVLAWYPIVGGLVTGLLLYRFGREVTDDQRIGLAAVAMLAIVPGNAFRTALGFADHHAFDYPWLVLTALGLAMLLAHEREWTRKTIAGVGALGVGVAGQVLAWEAGPLLALPVALVVLGRGLLDVHAGESPLRTGVPLLAGLALASVLAGAVHLGLGWATDQVGFTPALLFVGSAGAIGLAEGAHRLDRSARDLAAVDVVALVGGLGAFSVLLPEYWARFSVRFTGLFATRGIAETRSLFSDSFGWLTLLGFALFVAVPYLAWATRRVWLGDRRWLVPVVYAWYTLLLAMVQVRFVGEFGPFVALFAGVGLIHLAYKIDVARPPRPLVGHDGARAERPDRALSRPTARQAGAVIALFLLVGSLGMIQVPVKTGQTTIPNQQYEVADAISAYSDAHDLSYPENYVLSRWGRNRLYNYFASGESRSYSYAQRHYCHFVTTGTPQDAACEGSRAGLPSNASGWYDYFGGEVGFVVVHAEPSAPDATLYTRLHRGYGSQGAGKDALAHFRAIYVSSGGAHDKRWKVFAVVPGATITGDAPANSTVEVRVEKKVPGDSFEYVKTTKAGPDGTYSMTVPYAGEYAFLTANGTEATTVTVTDAAVTEGKNVSANAPAA